MSDVSSGGQAPFNPVDAAFGALLSAPDQASRDTAWSNLTAVASGGQFGPAQGVFKDLNTRAVQAAMNSPTGAAKESALWAIERSGEMLSGGDQQSQGTNAAVEPFEGFDPPQSIHDYQLAGVVANAVADQAGLNATLAAAFEAKIPAPIVQQAFTEAHRNHALLSDQNGYIAARDGAMVTVTKALASQLGGPEAVDQAFKVTADYVDGLAAKHPALVSGLYLMLANPWGLATLVNAARGAAGRRS